MICKHEKLSSTVLIVPPEEGGLHRAVLSVKCANCGAPFKFVGVPEGTGEQRPGVSADQRELWIPMVEEIPGRVQ